MIIPLIGCNFLEFVEVELDQPHRPIETYFLRMR